MEENKNRIVHGKLNLNVPPLSTRRVSGPTASSGSMPEPANMVPFSWERIPGEPKNRIPTNEDELSGVDRPPPPKPPPGWRLPPRSGGGDDEVNSRNEHFSDAIDIFSLAESVDDVESYCKATKDRSSAMVGADSGYVSSNFIIERFLPDAQALAEESVMNRKLPFSDSDSGSDSSFSRAVSIRRSQPSMKGCGLGSLLPWKMKPKPCSVKSPVCDTIIEANLKRKW